MPRQDNPFEKGPHLGDESSPESERRTIRFPAKPRSVQKKRPKSPPGLAPDAKRYNDDIPDPDAEETIPETS